MIMSNPYAMEMRPQKFCHIVEHLKIFENMTDSQGSFL